MKLVAIAFAICAAGCGGSGAQIITMPAKPKIAFICVENSNRSQMAEAFARLHGGEGIEAYSAGSKPSGMVNPKAVEAMKERGYDLTKHTSKSLEALPGELDVVVTMGCGDTCPNVKAKRRLDWSLPDPKTLTPDEYRKVRDEIEQRVKNLLTEVINQKSPPVVTGGP